MANVVVKENHLTFGGVTYFRGHAEEIEIGSIGEKRTPLLKQNYLEVKDRIQIPKVNVVKATVVNIDFTKTSKSAFNVMVSAIIKGVPAKLDGDASFEKMRSGELKLVKFSVLNNDMMKEANNLPEKLQTLIEWGKDARIVHQVFVVIEASLANEFEKNVNVELSAGIKGLEAKVGGGGSGSGSTTVRISKGTCFAYLMLKMDWDAKKKKKKTRIVDLDDDQWRAG